MLLFFNCNFFNVFFFHLMQPNLHFVKNRFNLLNLANFASIVASSNTDVVVIVIITSCLAVKTLDNSLVSVSVYIMAGGCWAGNQRRNTVP